MLQCALFLGSWQEQTGVSACGERNLLKMCCSRRDGGKDGAKNSHSCLVLEWCCVNSVKVSAEGSEGKSRECVVVIFH